MWRRRRQVPILSLTRRFKWQWCAAAKVVPEYGLHTVLWPTQSPSRIIVDVAGTCMAEKSAIRSPQDALISTQLVRRGSSLSKYPAIGQNWMPDDKRCEAYMHYQGGTEGRSCSSPPWPWPTLHAEGGRHRSCSAAARIKNGRHLGFGIPTRIVSARWYYVVVLCLWWADASSKMLAMYMYMYS